MTSADIIAIVKKQPIGFGCALASIILGALIYYRSGSIDERQAEYDDKAAEATKVAANVRNSQGLSEQVGEIKALTKEFESRLISAGQIAINQQYFYKLEAENEVKLVDVHQGLPPPGTKGTYLAVPFNVSVQGSYKQVLAFLQGLEKGRHFCRFSTVVFSKATGGGAESTGQAATSMNVTINLELLGQP